CRVIAVELSLYVIGSSWQVQLHIGTATGFVIDANGGARRRGSDFYGDAGDSGRSFQEARSEDKAGAGQKDGGGGGDQPAREFGWGRRWLLGGGGLGLSSRGGTVGDRG